MSYAENVTNCELDPDSLHWIHNGHDGVSNHQSHGCLLNRLFRRRSKKTPKLRVTGLCLENSSTILFNSIVLFKGFLDNFPIIEPSEINNAVQTIILELFM